MLRLLPAMAFRETDVKSGSVRVAHPHIPTTGTARRATPIGHTSRGPSYAGDLRRLSGYLSERNPVAGQQILGAYWGPTLRAYGGGDDIPDVDPVEPAGDDRWHSARTHSQECPSKMRRPEVPGADYGRWIEEYGVQSPFDSLAHFLLGLRLGPVVGCAATRIDQGALFIYREIKGFLLQGVDGAVVHQAANAARQACCHNLARAYAIDRLQERPMIRGKGDLGCRVVDHLGAFEGALQGVQVADIGGHRFEL